LLKCEYILSKATFRTSRSPDYQNLKFSPPLPTDIISILFLCCNNVCISIYHCSEWNRLPNLIPKMCNVSLLHWEYFKPKYLSSHKGLQCSCVLYGCSCDVLNNNGKVCYEVSTKTCYITLVCKFWITLHIFTSARKC
jgi:hypothetical protein